MLLLLLREVAHTHRLGRYLRSFPPLFFFQKCAIDFGSVVAYSCVQYGLASVFLARMFCTERAVPWQGEKIEKGGARRRGREMQEGIVESAITCLEQSYGDTSIMTFQLQIVTCYHGLLIHRE